MFKCRDTFRFHLNVCDFFFCVLRLLFACSARGRLQKVAVFHDITILQTPFYFFLNSHLGILKGRLTRPCVRSISFRSGISIWIGITVHYFKYIYN